MYKLFLYGFICVLLFNSCGNTNNPGATTGGGVDTSHEDFEHVKIGKQVWTVKNLDVDRYRDGTPIPEVKSDSAWLKFDTMQKGCWCYLLDSPSNGKKYGKLYNWYAVNDPRGLAPKGWHVPDTTEWQVLFSFCGGKNKAGLAMKYKPAWTTTHPEPSTGDNSSGFTALPGMSREVKPGAWGNGITFPPASVMECYGGWWTSTEIPNSIYACVYGLRWSFDTVGNDGPSKGAGHSVRCIKDKE
jgi:uncharacterized protein (TIGR02145 family)